jgi:hypothetical protein
MEINGMFVIPVKVTLTHLFILSKMMKFVLAPFSLC